MNPPSFQRTKRDTQLQEGHSWADKEEDHDNKLEWKEDENIIILLPVAEKADHGGRKPPPRLERVIAAMLTVFFRNKHLTYLYALYFPHKWVHAWHCWRFHTLRIHLQTVCSICGSSAELGNKKAHSFLWIVAFFFCSYRNQELKQLTTTITPLAVKNGVQHQDVFDSSLHQSGSILWCGCLGTGSKGCFCEQFSFWKVTEKNRLDNNPALCCEHYIQ